MSRSRIAFTLAVLSLLLVMVGMAPAGAAAAPSVGVSPAAVPAGNRVTFTAAGFAANTRLQFLVGPANSEASPVATVTTNANGRASFSTTIARAATPGSYVALACQRSCRVKATRSFRITRPLLTAAQAVARVRTILTQNAAACDMEVTSVRAVAIANARFRVVARVSTFGNVGDAAWIVNRITRVTTPNDQLAFEIASGCP
jgi:hypothetical protein